MILVRLLAVWKNLVHNDLVPQCDAIVHQTPHIFLTLMTRFQDISYGWYTYKFCNVFANQTCNKTINTKVTIVKPFLG